MHPDLVATRLLSCLPIIVLAASVGCVRPDTAANGGGDVSAGRQPVSAAAHVSHGTVDEPALASGQGRGQSAQSGLPEATVSFVNPDGSRSSFLARVASTESQRATGLMFVKGLPADHAMLFVFQDEAVRSFYMKNTYIALDMVFVGADGVVAGVVENARPLTLDSRGVDRPARFVLEINAWEAGRRGIRAGSVMTVSPSSVLAF